MLDFVQLAAKLDDEIAEKIEKLSIFVILDVQVSSSNTFREYESRWREGGVNIGRRGLVGVNCHPTPL